MDRILLSSHYDPSANHACGGDGYSGSYDAEKSKPVAWNIPLDALQDANISNAFLQIPHSGGTSRPLKNIIHEII